MNVADYLTHELNLAQAQVEAIEQLADVCGMTSLFEASFAELAKKRAMQHAAAKTAPVEPTVIKSKVSERIVEDEPSDEPANLYDIMHAYDDNSWTPYERSKRGKNTMAGALSLAADDDDSINGSDLGFEMDHVQQDAIDNLDKKEDVADVSDEDMKLMNIVKMLALNGGLDEAHTKKLMVDAAQLAAVGSNTDSVDELVKANGLNTVGDVESNDSNDAVVSELRSLMQSVKMSGKPDVAQKLSNMMKEFANEFPNNSIARRLNFGNASNVMNDETVRSSDQWKEYEQVYNPNATFSESEIATQMASAKPSKEYMKSKMQESLARIREKRLASMKR